jgi:phospholipid-binding lipoprotein MlaA
MALSGCSTLNQPTDPNDPLEGYNRNIFEFNEGVDKHILKPVAQGYDNITPTLVQKGISNFFSNLDDFVVVINDLLQFKLGQLSSDTGRLLINSTLGLGGLIDWAADINMPKHNEDFGQTLGHWGIPPGPYFVLPFLGPSTIRDTSGIIVDTAELDPIWRQVEDGLPAAPRDSGRAQVITAIKAVDLRASLLKVEKILDEAALDKYIFIREAYLQRREYLVFDGNPPIKAEEFNEDELFDFDK